MPWIVKYYRLDAYEDVHNGETELRIVHTDGRETNYAEYFEDAYEPDRYDEDFEPPDFGKWKLKAEGIAFAMNEAEEIAEASGFPLIYPSDIDISPGCWRVQNTTTQKFDYFRRNGEVAHIQYVTWRVYLLGPHGEEETLAEGEWSTDSDDSDSNQIRSEGSNRLFEATYEARDKADEINARQNPNT